MSRFARKRFGFSDIGPQGDAESFAPFDPVVKPPPRVVWQRRRIEKTDDVGSRQVGVGQLCRRHNVDFEGGLASRSQFPGSDRFDPCRNRRLRPGSHQHLPGPPHDDGEIANVVDGQGIGFDKTEFAVMRARRQISKVERVASRLVGRSRQLGLVLERAGGLDATAILHKGKRRVRLFQIEFQRARRRPAAGERHMQLDRAGAGDRFGRQS